jgi:hypothetical protein
MRQFQAEFDLFQFDIPKITEWYDRRIRRAFRDAITEFVIVAESLVPVLTGRAKGTYLKVVRSLRLNVTLDFRPNSPYIDMLEYFDFDQELGAAETYVAIDQRRGYYEFSLFTNVPYFGRWETNMSSGGRGLWESMDTGEEILENFFNTYIEDYLPTFDDFEENEMLIHTWIS